MDIQQLRTKVNAGVDLLKLLKQEYPQINHPDVDAINHIVLMKADVDKGTIFGYQNKVTICLPTTKGWLILDKLFGESKYRPQIVGVIAEETDLYKRETYVLDGMSDHDVINYLQELSK